MSDSLPPQEESLSAGDEARKRRVIDAARQQADQSLPAETETHRGTKSSSDSGNLEVRCPSCHTPLEVAVDTQLTDLTCSSCGSHFSLVDQDQATHLAPALTQLGRFELIERLGIGGFGSVWKARDKQLDRTVAIKVPRQGGMTPEEQEKFFREARAAAQLKHPGIVSVHEVGRDGDSVYIVSDFVRGVTLGDWLTGQQLTTREAAELMAKIADALHHAHEQGVIHRDLKPANIMIDGNGEPHLMDFGLARRDAGEITMTIDGQVLGTPAYMSPEQAAGEGHTADRRSDVYSLGVILFQLLTDELPFRGNARMLMHQVIHDEPPNPRKLNGNVPRDLETITLKCLEKDASRRYHTASELAGELRRFLTGQPILARPISRVARGWRWCKRHPQVSISLAGIVMALFAVAAVSTWSAVRLNQAREYERTARDTDLAILKQRLEEAANSRNWIKHDEATSVLNTRFGDVLEVQDFLKNARSERETLQTRDEQKALDQIELIQAVDKEGDALRASLLHNAVPVHLHNTRAWKDSERELKGIRTRCLERLKKEPNIKSSTHQVFTDTSNDPIWKRMMQELLPRLKGATQKRYRLAVFRLLLENEMLDEPAVIVSDDVGIAVVRDEWTDWDDKYLELDSTDYAESRSFIVLFENPEAEVLGRQLYVQINTFRHRSLWLPVAFEKDRLVTIGTVVVKDVPDSELGTLQISLESGDGSTIRPTTFYVCRDFGRTMDLFPLEMSPGEVKLAPGIYQIEHDDGDTLLECTIESGKLTHLDFSAFAPRKLTLEWRFRSNGNGGAWQKLTTVAKTGERIDLPIEYDDRLISIHSTAWKGSGCSIISYSVALTDLVSLPSDRENLPSVSWIPESETSIARIGAIYMAKVRKDPDEPNESNSKGWEILMQIKDISQWEPDLATTTNNASSSTE